MFLLGEGGQARTDASTYARMKKTLAPIEFGKPMAYSVDAFLGPDIVVCAFRHPARVDVYVAGKKATAVRRFARSFDLELDEF